MSQDRALSDTSNSFLSQVVIFQNRILEQVKLKSPVTYGKVKGKGDCAAYGGIWRMSYNSNRLAHPH
jgi:hypothetical protein